MMARGDDRDGHDAADSVVAGRGRPPGPHGRAAPAPVTVHNHLTAITTELGASTCAEAAALARDHGWL